MKHIGLWILYLFRMYLHRYLHILHFLSSLCFTLFFCHNCLFLTMRTNVHTIPSYIIKICTQIFFLIVEVKAKFEGTMYTFHIGIYNVCFFSSFLVLLFISFFQYLVYLFVSFVMIWLLQSFELPLLSILPRVLS